MSSIKLLKLQEKAPPGDKAESWIQKNKSRFIERYGKEDGTKILYAKAWKLFKEEDGGAPTNATGDSSPSNPDSTIAQPENMLGMKKKNKNKILKRLMNIFKKST